MHGAFDIINRLRGAQDRAADAPAPNPRAGLGASEQTVLVLQGGGALGAYQVGVYQALHEAGVEPDWVIGTSIGAINAALIAGNAPEHRMDRLTDFWSRIEHSPGLEAISATPWLGGMLPNWSTLATGVASFFRPNPVAFLGAHAPLAAEAAGYYTTRPLERTLSELVDFARIGENRPRLTVGAANVRTADMRYFDSRDGDITVKHIMASGALPPAFPAIRIEGELYWDGGILSNTPVEAVFDDNPRRSSLIFAVHIWNPHGAEPESIWQVMNRHKDIQYSSRAISHIKRQNQIHRMRHIIAQLAMRLPPGEMIDPEVRDMAAQGCMTQMQVVRLLAPRLDGEDHTKDIDFSRAGIRERRERGYEDAMRALRAKPWESETLGSDGVVLHEFARDA